MRNPFRRRDPISRLHRQGKHRLRTFDKMCTFPACEKKRGHRGPHQGGK